MAVISGGRVIEGALRRVGSPTAENTSGVPAVHGGFLMAYAQYAFAVEGGAVGDIALTGALIIPSGAIVLGGVLEVVTPPTSGGAATLALKVEGAADLVAAAAISGAPWSTAGRKSLIPAFTGATSVKTTAARDIVATVATAALTAGVFNVYVVYFETV